MFQTQHFKWWMQNISIISIRLEWNICKGEIFATTSNVFLLSNYFTFQLCVIDRLKCYLDFNSKPSKVVSRNVHQKLKLLPAKCFSQIIELQLVKLEYRVHQIQQTPFNVILDFTSSTYVHSHNHCNCMYHANVHENKKVSV